ncbi:MAG: hypothetical protein RBS91_07780 [Sulfurimonadaceae bacterium]|jgi:hypothetical protein|nr:hypothetical protein [Sulfurimonadaceae bacterium]
MVAQVRSEEKFARLCITYAGEEEENLICSTVDTIAKKYGIEPESFKIVGMNDQNSIVVECDEEMERIPGDFFEDVIKVLNVKVLH